MSCVYSRYFSHQVYKDEELKNIKSEFSRFDNDISDWNTLENDELFEILDDFYPSLTIESILLPDTLDNELQLIQDKIEEPKKQYKKKNLEYVKDYPYRVMFYINGKPKNFLCKTDPRISRYNTLLYNYEKDARNKRTGNIIESKVKLQFPYHLYNRAIKEDLGIIYR